MVTRDRRQSPIYTEVTPMYFVVTHRYSLNIAVIL